MLANEFKARLTLLSMTQQAYADAVGVSLRTVSKWLNETTIPTIAILALEALENRQRVNN